MKKLIMVATVALAAVITQAASVKWTSGALYTAAGESGGFSETKIKSAATAYLFTLTEADYKSFLSAYNTSGNMSKVYETYKGSLSSEAATATGKTASLSSSSTITTSADVGATVYGAIIYTYTDATLGKDFYIANIATGTVGSDSGLSLGNLGTIYLGEGTATGTAIGGWQVEGTSPVPEPTSVMLLMLGLCGLALKRKQA